MEPLIVDSFSGSFLYFLSTELFALSVLTMSINCVEP